MKCTPTGKLAAVPMLLLLVVKGLQASSDGRPRVTFFSEALCPYCRAFTLDTLEPMFNKGVAKLMKLELVPWGNARLSPGTGNLTWSCQHGEAECRLNSLLSCTIHHYPDQEEWFPYLACLERGAITPAAQNMEQLSSKCAAVASMDPHTIWQCHTGPEGRALQLAAGMKTQALQPPHSGVPWLTMTSQHGGDSSHAVPLYDAADALLSLVCAAYGGKDRTVMEPWPTAGDAAPGRGGGPAAKPIVPTSAFPRHTALPGRALTDARRALAGDLNPSDAVKLEKPG